MVAISIDYLDAVHQHAFDSGREAVRCVEGRVVVQHGGVEHHEVGRRTVSNSAALLPAESMGSAAGHLANGLLEREQALSNVGRENSWEGAEAGRILVAFVGQEGVGFDTAEGVGEDTAQRRFFTVVAAVGVV
jgi:hypothetical protein